MGAYQHIFRGFKWKVVKLPSGVRVADLLKILFATSVEIWAIWQEAATMGVAVVEVWNISVVPVA